MPGSKPAASPIARLPARRADPASPPASTSACCSWVTSKTSTRSAASLGGALTACRCASSWGPRWIRIPPDHSTLSATRQRLPAEVFSEVFEFVLSIAVNEQLVDGRTVGVDSTTLEANAAMKSIVRRDSGEDWKAYIRRLMQESGEITAEETPSDEDLRRFDKGRKDK
jgi:hypothetical protein